MKRKNREEKEERSRPGGPIWIEINEIEKEQERLIRLGEKGKMALLTAGKDEEGNGIGLEWLARRKTQYQNEKMNYEQEKRIWRSLLRLDEMKKIMIKGLKRAIEGAEKFRQWEARDSRRQKKETKIKGMNIGKGKEEIRAEERKKEEEEIKENVNIKLKMVKEAFEVMTALLKIAVLRDKYIPEEPRNLLKGWGKELGGTEGISVNPKNPLAKEWKELLTWKEKYELAEREKNGPTKNETDKKNKLAKKEKLDEEKTATLSDFEYYVWGVLLQFHG